MKHARADYDRIQDPAGLIPEDEPVFLIRGQDRVSPQAVEHWAALAESYGADQDIVQAAREQAVKMRDWQTSRRWKLPDLPDPDETQAIHGHLSGFEMSDQDLRLECLKLAVRMPHCGTPMDATIRARELFDYVKGESR